MYTQNGNIIDPDGYTNLRKDKNTSSEILQKVKSGEHIDVLDNTGDWFLVKTKKEKLYIIFMLIYQR
ncbi:SH3 domain-containing protein [Chryseobacterium capnotolerans]|uniref:SH3 domain-containing protein n=1 Tax=Chryseobacterium TaxID=59732 RepID=UPI00083B3FD3|nr:SH3 domain-containing protein [Chryseobacterium capnotolerans]